MCKAEVIKRSGCYVHVIKTQSNGWALVVSSSKDKMAGNTYPGFVSKKEAIASIHKIV